MSGQNVDDEGETFFIPEQVKLAAWHIETLVFAGFDVERAGRMAARAEFDYRRALALLKHGCPEELVEKILA